MLTIKQSEKAKPKEKPCLLMAETELLTESWDSWFDGNAVTADFISAREQPADQVKQTGPTPTDDAISD